MLFLRFGEIPKNEKSINFIKSSGDVELFSCDFEYPGENKQIVYENGVSVFEIDQKTLLPVLNTLPLCLSFSTRITTNAYIIDAEQVGNGNDNEPLVRNIESLKPWKVFDYENRNSILEQAMDVLFPKKISHVREKEGNGNFDYTIYMFFEEEYINKDGEVQERWSIPKEDRPNWKRYWSGRHYLGTNFAWIEEGSYY